jgi:hypothetical protein
VPDIQPVLNISVEKPGKRASNWMLHSSNEHSQSNSFDDTDGILKGNNCFMQNLNSEALSKKLADQDFGTKSEVEDLLILKGRENRGTAFTFVDNENNLKDWSRATTFQPNKDDEETIDLSKITNLDFKSCTNDIEYTPQKTSVKMSNIEISKESEINTVNKDINDEDNCRKISTDILDFELTPIKKNPIKLTNFEINQRDNYQALSKTEIKKMESKNSLNNQDVDSLGFGLDLSKFKAKDRMKSRNISDASAFLNKSDNNIKKHHFNLDESIIPNTSRNENFITDTNNIMLTEVTLRSEKVMPKLSYKINERQETNNHNDYSYTVPNKLNTTAKSAKTNKEDSSYLKSYKTKKAHETEVPKVNMGYINKNPKKSIVTDKPKPKQNESNVYEIDDLKVNYKKKGDSTARYVLLQKQQKYNKYTDLQKNTKHLDKNEIIYNNIADSQTIDHLVNSVKNAYKSNSKSRPKSRPSTNEKASKSDKQNKSKSVEEHQEAKGSITSVKPADESHLFQMLEEIRSRSEVIEDHFKDKELYMGNMIKELKENLYQHEQTEIKMKEEMASMKYKLAFFIQDYKNRSK